MKTLNDYLKEKLENPEFAKVYKEIQEEMNIIREDVDAGEQADESNMSE